MLIRILAVLSVIALFGNSAHAQAQVIYNPANGHYYERIAGSITWEQSKADAETRHYEGYTGYLVTLTSQEESDFIVAGFGGNNISGYHIGAYQTTNSLSPSTGWRWVTGEAWNFTNWSVGEPNDYENGTEANRENFAQLSFFASNGSWNDLTSGYAQNGYIVEYGGYQVSVSGRLLLQTAATQAYPVTFDFRPTDGSEAFSHTVTLNADGTYVLTDIPVNIYRIRIKGAKWMAKTVLADARNGNVSNVNASLLTGDANNDNFVDISDLLVLISAYNQVSPASGYSEAADFDGSGANDITDLLFLIVNYNQQGDS